ncbi:hypothetical protein [Nitrogeniibacter aestuarii]|uniref:hypothetical protein n=1 Tax=Nitrogeniibacter aestuarii TaxID=2815343 RepID=UPI001E4B2E97|nr:hypothetical protein [Nitrogeniibacter aestuarii]
MQVQLVIPGLMWPSEQARGYADALHLPALTTLLGRASVTRNAPASPERCLSSVFGLDSSTFADAPLRRLGEEDGLRTTEPLLCADPTHLHFSRDHLLLADASELEIHPDEAAALVAALNDTFADVGHFEGVTPTHWYLAPKGNPQVRFASLGDATSRPVAFFMPEGDDARLWERTANEIQVFLHNHAINAERERRGLRAINSVWFWGLGCLPGMLEAPAQLLVMSSTHGRGLARAAGLEPVEAARWSDLPPADSVLLELDMLLGPSRYMDISRWHDALHRLETDWCAPVLDALRSRRISRLVITLPDERGSRELNLTPTRLLQFWRKVESLEAFTILQYL